MLINGTSGDDVLNGTTGDDTISGLAGRDTLSGLAGNDVLSGGDGVDSLSDGEGDDSLDGGAGDDVLFSGLGADTLNGGDGFDEIQITRSGASANLIISATTIDDVDLNEHDVYSNIELISVVNSRFSAFNDTLDGAAATVSLLLYGGDGDDIIIGGAGGDMIEGVTGDDTLSGGAGADVFDFDFTEDISLNGDIITDFENSDVIDFATINTTGEAGSAQGLDLTFIGNNTFSGAAGEFRYEAGGGQTQIQVDEDGDGAADRFVFIMNGEFAFFETYADSAVLSTTPISPTENNDSIVGTVSDDVIDALGGNDTVDGLGGNDLLWGRAGDDTLAGGAGDDTLSGGDGDDELRDSIEGGGFIDGGDGVDTVVIFDAVTIIEGLSADDPNNAFHLKTAFDGDALYLSNVEFYEYPGRFEQIVIELLLGSTNNDTLIASDPDTITDIAGGAGDDTLTGDAGQDYIFTGTGNDFIDGGGGAADNVFFQFNGEATGIAITDSSVSGLSTGEVKTFSNVEELHFSGAPSSLDLSGNFLFDASAVSQFGLSFSTLNGDDTLIGGDGNDTLGGRGGRDWLTGDDGDDFLSGGFEGADALSGGSGDDTLNGGAGADVVDGGAGSDTADYAGSSAGVLVRLWSGAGERGDAEGDTLSGIENLSGSSLNDLLIGANGDANFLSGGEGNDYLSGLSGDDTLNGGVGADTLQGGSGNDILRGGSGTDFLRGASGNDTMNGGADADRLIGGTGRDTADYTGSSSGVLVRLWSGAGERGDAEGDVLSDFENLSGSSLNDLLIGADGDANVLSGQDGNDFLSGLSGRDTLEGGAGADTLDGGLETDMADYAGSSSGVLVRLWDGTGAGGDAEGDVLTEIEQLIGSSLNDALIGEDLVANRLTGNGGDDFLSGLSGDDTLYGRTGADISKGGSGDDRFAYGAGDGDDTILDFVAGAGTDDVIVLYGFGAAFDNFAEVTAAASDDGTDTTIDFGNGDVILLQNVTVAQLHEDDFIFR